MKLADLLAVSVTTMSGIYLISSSKLEVERALALPVLGHSEPAVCSGPSIWSGPAMVAILLDAAPVLSDVCLVSSFKFELRDA